MIIEPAPNCPDTVRVELFETRTQRGPSTGSVRTEFEGRVDPRLCRRVDNQRLQGGFSLLEVLVAFTIMSLSLGILYQVAAGAVRNAAFLERQAHALVVAESLVALNRTVSAGGRSESGGSSETFEWRLNARPLSPSPLPDESPLSIYELEVTVSWLEAGRPRHVQLHTLVPESRSSSAEVLP